MRELSDEFVASVAQTAWQQIKTTASADTIGSWGISELYAQEIATITEGYRLHMPALVMKVSGLQHTGLVIVALNEGKDLYCIYTAKADDDELKVYEDEVYCDMLAGSLDKCIERGDLTDAQYQQRIQALYFL